MEKVLSINAKSKMLSFLNGKCNLVAIMLIFAGLFLWIPVASASSFSWINPLDTSAPASNTDPQYFDQVWGETLPGWDITEGRRAVNDWTVSGAAGSPNYNTNFTKLWLFSGSASTTLTAQTDSVVFLMHGDFNDGFADFYVDNILIDTRDMYDNGPSGRYQAMIVTGLDDIIHTLTVGRAGQKNDSSTGYDLAIIGGGAIAPSAPVPIPGTMVLFGIGIMGLAGVNRKN